MAEPPTSTQKVVPGWPDQPMALGVGLAAPESASNHLQVPGGVSARSGGQTTPDTRLAGLKPWGGSATQQPTFFFNLLLRSRLKSNAYGAIP